MSFAGIKTLENKIDPYTRATIGITVVASMLFSQNPIVRYAVIGIDIAGFLQAIDIFKGGRLSSNEARSRMFVLHEQLGFIELKENEVPNYNIDGFTFEGMKIF